MTFTQPDHCPDLSMGIDVAGGRPVDLSQVMLTSYSMNF